MKTSASAQLKAMLGKFETPVAKVAAACVAKLRKAMPGACVLVYDNYNALAIAFSSTEEPRDILCSIAVYPRYPSLFLMHGPKLDDPEGLLEGSGTRVRHVKLTDGEKVLERPAVRALLKQSIALCEAPMPRKGGAVIIRSVSKKQRPRR